MASTKVKHRRTSHGTQYAPKGVSARLAAVEKSQMRSDYPVFKAGDTLKVHVRIKEGEKERIQIFEGLVIALANSGANRSFTVRKVSHGVGVERIFMHASPKVAKVEIAQEGRVRRAKLYYIRELEGKAAKVDREIETQASAATSAAAKEAKAAK